MRFFEFATAITAIGCGTGVILGTVEMVLSARRPRARLDEAPAPPLTQEQQAQQAQEIAQLRLQNEQLQKQIEWHTRLLAAEFGPAGAATVTTARNLPRT
jgi:hypothetical protein